MNLIIAEPYKKSPLGGLALGPLFEKAGFLKGDFQILPGDGLTGTCKSYMDKDDSFTLLTGQISSIRSVSTGK
ncbi:uncharacterized protein Z519_03466 [Cladophialophora bantiana CBS 173.52]|uniref:Uncharacterized protein n=1 Tax=Cladophialophora bantiana (strain ATCC 10958 / CBS 173.52 / CDC B-1940 / NIH 8579) TaxID=1442370 RepID=A0A0D2GDC1_CLAB1|nr:uncharacterized protein Z519_03466 [Cladophialophora bantiana CBS 173.52]KIW96397.1 hypothetical protein Z519_03466 [Cladophialophora bantiana CBS 173.52]